ncbi:MAG: cation transporter [Eubacteriales bacterium]|nr:cation transporter [Eubacteriales bacterium]
MKKTYSIMVDCPNCAEKMETAAKNIPGVVNCRVNFMALKMKVDFEDGVDEKSVMDAVAKACRRVEPDCSIDY